MTNKSLFSPFSINNHELKNRFVMAPMTRNFSPEGIPSEYAPEYYAKRARGGVALILTEGVEVSHPSSSGYPDVPNLTSSESKKCGRELLRKFTNMTLKYSVNFGMLVELENQVLIKIKMCLDTLQADLSEPIKK